MSVPAKATGRTKKSAAWKSIKNNYMLYLFLVPALVYVAVFCYAPMYGVQIAFKNFKASKGIMGSAWVGLAHFKTFFSSPRFMLLLTNTLSVSVYSIIVGFPIPIILALLFNYVQYPWFKKFAQTVSYAPHFISTVVLVGMLSMFFSTTTGFVNTAIAALGFNKIHFFGEPQYFRHLYVWSGVWQNMGWSAVIYIATLSGVDPQQHEAARIDGANRWKQTIHVTLPGILPTIILLLILRIGSMMNVGHEKIILLYNDYTMETADVISSYVYRRGMIKGDYSFSAAVGLFNSVINFAMVVIANRISNKTIGSGIF